MDLERSAYGSSDFTLGPAPHVRGSGAARHTFGSVARKQSHANESNHFARPLGLSILCALAVITRPLDSAATHFAPNWNVMHTKHRWDAIPGKWESIGQPPVGTTIDLRIALKSHREHALTDAVHEVSNPKHPKHVLFFIPPPTHVTLLRCRYGAYLCKEQVAELVTPAPIYAQARRGLGLSTTACPFPSHGGNWLTVTGVPVSKANELLGASYQLYRYAGTNETILRTGGGALSTRDTIVPPAFLRSLYNSVTYQPAATEQNMIRCFFGEYVGDEDLKKFMRLYRSDANDATLLVIDINDSGYDPNKPGNEANLNMQYTQGITWPTPHVFYSIGGVPGDTPENEPFLEWLELMIELEDVPERRSARLTVARNRPSRLTMRRACANFSSSSARAASAYSSRVVTMVLAAGTARKTTALALSNFSPFPCDMLGYQSLTTPPHFSGPWVTSIGGTMKRPEVAAPLSSGGFSNVFQRPVYQTDAALGFFQQLGNHASSRGFPDVAAQAMDFVITLNDDLDLMDGTSCSAPVVAGIISLLNDYQLSMNRPVLGFFNPWLYGTASQGFNDITSGSNPGCDTDGFSAVPGWDPVTGLGTPDLQRLLERLPTPIPIPTN
ncbi:subtilisin-like protein [Lactarius sanguifluus]|nr:subtilisin-like protein [Lactarius sanguifluus]